MFHSVKKLVDKQPIIASCRQLTFFVKDKAKILVVGLTLLFLGNSGCCHGALGCPCREGGGEGRQGARAVDESHGC